MNKKSNCRERFREGAVGKPAGCEPPYREKQ